MASLEEPSSPFHEVLLGLQPIPHPPCPLHLLLQALLLDALIGKNDPVHPLCPESSCVFPQSAIPTGHFL